MKLLAVCRPCAGADVSGEIARLAHDEMRALWARELHPFTALGVLFAGQQRA
jgi:hypothetical protein